MRNGPAKSIPVRLKTALGVTHCGGSCPVSCRSVLAAFLRQVTTLTYGADESLGPSDVVSGT